MLVFVGIPLFYLELAIGQFTSSGPLTCWDFAPIFKGSLHNLFFKVILIPLIALLVNWQLAVGI
jgi:hypothetical protein